MFEIIKVLILMKLLIPIKSNYSNNDTLNCYSDTSLTYNLYQNNKLSEQINIATIKNTVSLLKEELLKFMASMYNFGSDVDDVLYDLLSSIDQECFDFVLNFFFNETDFFRDLYSRILHGGGLQQYSIDTEDDCLNDGGVYLLFVGEYDRNSLRNENTTISKEKIFREAYYVRDEFCIVKECKHFYKQFFQYFFEYQKEKLKNIFHWKDIKISGINFKQIQEEEKIEKTKEEIEKEEVEKKYFDNIKIILIVLTIFFVSCSFFSCFIRTFIINKLKKREVAKENIEEINGGYDKLIEMEENKELIKTDTFKSIHLAKERSKIYILYKIIDSFDFLKNLSKLNDTKDSLYDQNKLIQLSVIKLLTLLFIMLGENTYIILKYIENKMSVLSFCKDYLFFFIKLGMNSYETYKVICGILVGFKFMSFYHQNKNKSNVVIFVKFCLKPIPYIFMFYLIHLLFNYPIFIYAKNLFGSTKSNYLSTIMEQCSCQKGPFKLFRFIPILLEYNATEFNIGQYNGCSRPILFSLSKICCFYFVLIIAMINICLFSKGNKVNICYILLFIVNFLILLMMYFLTKEVNDLTDEYTISRLFGLSGSIALPTLFFPLYYIGFNIGIIFYYKENSLKNEAITDMKPFKYCDDINKIITSYSNKTLYLFMFIFAAFIILFSFSYTFLIYSMKNGEFLFNFKELPICKFIFVYNGIFQGIFFSFFILFYLCSRHTSIKAIFSSEIFNFFHKISFTLFVIFFYVLNFFHFIEIMEIYLIPFSMITITFILFILSCLLSILLSCALFFPIKQLFLYWTKGFDYYEEK